MKVDGFFIKWGNTALMTAARNGNIQAVQFLLERGANVWAKCEVRIPSNSFSVLLHNMSSRKV